MQYGQLTKREILMVLKMRDEASDPMKKFGDETDNTSDKMKGFEGQVAQASSTLKEFAVGFASAFSAGAIVTKATADFRAYETGMLGVAKTTGMAGQELSKFSQSFDSTAMDMSVPLQDMLAISQAAGQLGIKGSADILAFTDTIAKLQTASDLTAEDAAMSLARIGNVTGEGMAGIENYANVVVALGNNVAATESEITRVALELAKSTAIYELGTNAVAGYAAAFAQIGTQPDIAASSLARVIAELDNAANVGGQSLKDVAEIIGITAEEFTLLIKDDPSKALTQFLGALQPVLNDTGKLNTVFKGLNLQGEEIRKTILPLVKEFGNLERALEIADTGSREARALQDEYELFASSMDSLMVRLSNRMTVLFKNIGVGLEPILTPILEGLADLIEFVADALGNMPAPLRTMTAAALVAAPALGGLAATIRLMTGGLPLMTVALGVATTAIRALMGPLGLLSIAVSGVIYAFGQSGDAADAVADLTSAGTDALTALRDYAQASVDAGQSQRDLKGDIDEATEALVSQRRAALLIARDKLEESMASNSAQQVDDGWILNSNLGRFADGFKKPELRDTAFAAEIEQMRQEVEAGERSLGSLSERFEELAGISRETGQAAADMLTALNTGNGMSAASRNLVAAARSAGLFKEQLDAVDKAVTDEDKAKALRALAFEVGAVALAGAQLRDEDSVGNSLYNGAQAAAVFEPRLQMINDALNGVITTSEVLEQTDPLKPITDSANEAVTKLGELKLAMEDLPKDIQVSLNGMDGATDAVTAARNILREKEGYRDRAYDDGKTDENGQRVGPAVWRAGFGSDTTTMLGTDGKPMVVKITQDSVVNEMDSLRDLDRRIRDEFMPAAARALGEVWDTLTPAQQGYMTSLTYNYGTGAWNNPNTLGRVAAAAPQGKEAMSQAVLSLASQNGGINAGRRQEEAAALLNNTGSAGVLKNYETEQREREQAAEDAAEETRKLAESQAEYIKSISGTSEGLRLEQQLIGKSAAEKAYLTEKTKLLAEAVEEGIDLDAVRADIGMTTRQAIEQEAQAVMRLTAANENLMQVEERRKAMGNGLVADIGKGIEEFAQTLDSSVELASNVVDSLTSASSTFLSNMLDENMGFFDALKATASSTLADIGRMLMDHAIKVLIFKNLLGLGSTDPSSTAALASAKGNSFDAMGVQQFAKGGDFTNGVYTRPTMFRFGANKLGVMGEAGPEAVMPLENEGQGNGVVFETIDPITKKKVRRVVPISRDASGKLIASDAQMFAKGGSFGRASLSGMAAAGDTAQGGRSGPVIGSLSVSTGFNVQQAAGGGLDEKTATKVSKTIDNEVQSTVARTVMKMMEPGGILYRG